MEPAVGLVEQSRRLAVLARDARERDGGALILEQPPSIAAGEITDKGSINQRAVLQSRRDAVDALYSSVRDARVVVLS